MRFNILLSTLLIAGGMSVGVSAASATTTVSRATATVATPALIPPCPPRYC